MSAPEQPISFDFNAAAARLRQDYPEETKNLTIVDLGRDDCLQAVADWVATTSPEYQNTPQMKSFLEPEAFEIAMLQMGALSLKDPISGKGLVIAATREEDKPFTIPALMSAAFMFYHEMGHHICGALPTSMEEILLDPATPEFEDSRRRMEITADRFAVLKGFHDGVFTTVDMLRLAVFREKMAAIIDDTTHDTSTPLKETIKAYNEKAAAALNPAQIQKIAQAQPGAPKGP